MVPQQLHKPVFVVGLHRTGSTLLRNMLDANSALAMATDEMDVSNPWKRTFEQDLQFFHRRKGSASLQQLVDLIYSGRIHSTFWQDYAALGIPRERILARLGQAGTSLPAVMTVLLDEYRQRRRKERVGVKYPLHISRVDRLYRWFAGCKVILLTRDIRAICASKLNDPATRRRKARAPAAGAAVHYATMALFLADYLWSVRIYRRFGKRHDFRLVRFEDLVAQPVATLRRLCEFCEVPFEQTMLDVTGKPSSMGGEISRGIDPQRCVRWQRSLSRIDRQIITSMTRNGMNCFGYRSSRPRLFSYEESDPWCT